MFTKNKIFPQNQKFDSIAVLGYSTTDMFNRICKLSVKSRRVGAKGYPTKILRFWWSYLFLISIKKLKIILIFPLEMTES